MYNCTKKKILHVKVEQFLVIEYVTMFYFKQSFSVCRMNSVIQKVCELKCSNCAMYMCFL